VRLILAEELTGEAFRFSPLQGETYQTVASEKERQSVPTTIVVQREDGVLLMRSTAVIHIMRRLGACGRLAGGAAHLVPVRLRDRLYDGVAAVRTPSVLPGTESACPLLPPQPGGRDFDL